MTPIAGFTIAVIAGLIVKDGRRATLVVVVPWLIVLGYQSWYIASGRAVSPPGTVTDFPSAFGYWLVQAIIAALSLGVAAQLGALLSRHYALGHHSDRMVNRTRIASALGVAASVIIILMGFVWFRQEGGTVFVAHHSSDGSPPVIGIVGLLMSVVTCGGFVLVTFRRRRISRNRRLAQEPATLSASR